ncbi:MAG: hypothetical protein IJB74_03205, partial [Clostridia bacterium]|nr:hypothetical protein [Clostridia bacterium]
ENYLADSRIAFSDLNNSEKNVSDVQEALFDILKHKLMETDCSGAFIVLDASVNTSVENALHSRTGLYLQHSSIDSSDNGILLYRGLSELGKEHGVMPHRKWRLEFNTDLFPNYAELINGSDLPLQCSYRISDVFTLTGTSERAVLFTLPIIGDDGTIYGLCGFEISESYFKHVFSQPTNLDHVVFAVNSGSDGIKNAADSFSCGIANGYYLAPKGEFTTSSFGNGLTLFEGNSTSYIGVTKQIKLCKDDCDFSISILIPKQDYNSWSANNTVRIILLMLLLVTATVGCCFYFSRRFLLPIKRGLEQIKHKEYGGYSNVTEIDDLFAFLAEQDRIAEAHFAEMESQKATMQSTLDQMTNEKNEAEQKAARLAYSRKNEVDPYDYEQFLMGVKTLTSMERTVFDYYLAGMSVKQIVELAGIKESTVRFHNRNIYSKLGVNSLKQLLLYAAIMKQNEEGGDTK